MPLVSMDPIDYTLASMIGLQERDDVNGMVHGHIGAWYNF